MFTFCTSCPEESVLTEALLSRRRRCFDVDALAVTAAVLVVNALVLILASIA
jgi:hypothetical protein